MTEKIVSKKSLIQTGLILILAIGLFGTLSVFSIFKIIEDLDYGKPFYKTLFIVPLIFLPFSIYSVYYLLAKFPKLTIDKSGLNFSTIFNSQTYQWNEVEHIELTGKQFHKFLFFPMPIEATTFIFKDGTTLYFWADYYKNISDIRFILERAQKLLNDEKPLTSLNFEINREIYLHSEVEFSPEVEYNRNHVLTFNGITFYTILILFGFIILKTPLVSLTKLGAILSVGCIITLFCGIISFQMHYFILTDKFLIVKNSIWFWRKHVYSIENIREVVFEIPHNLSTSMRIITKDFQSKLYPAGNLNNKKWKELELKLKTKGIEIRNEAFI